MSEPRTHSASPILHSHFDFWADRAQGKGRGEGSAERQAEGRGMCREIARVYEAAGYGPASDLMGLRSGLEGGGE